MYSSSNLHTHFVHTRMQVVVAGATIAGGPGSAPPSATGRPTAYEIDLNPRNFFRGSGGR